MATDSVVEMNIDAVEIQPVKEHSTNEVNQLIGQESRSEVVLDGLNNNATDVFSEPITVPEIRNDRGSSCWHPWCTRTFGIVIIVVVYVVANMDLHKQFRKCRDSLVSDLTLATVLDATPELVTYDIGDNTCNAVNFGQNINTGARYMIYRSNNGNCGLEKKKDECHEGLVRFNVLFTAFGVPLILACTCGDGRR